MFKQMRKPKTTHDLSTHELIDWQDSDRSRDGTLFESVNKISPGPHKITKWDLSRVSSVIIDLVLLGLTLVFGAYGFFAMVYNGYKSDSQAYKVLSQAARIGPTVFPILFAAVVGRALRQIALYKLEGGARIGHLDQLVSSTSITSTITAQFKLRAANLLGVVLVVLWTLSPIGSQASIRVLEVNSNVMTKDIDIYFVNASSRSINDRYSRNDTAGTFIYSNALFAAALSTPESIRASTMDIWGNVKIPLLETFTPSKADADGWYAAEQPSCNYAANTYEGGPPDSLYCTNKSPNYASLIGLPFSSADNMGNHSFNMETNYWYLDCSRPKKIERPSQCNTSGWDVAGNDFAGMYLSSPPTNWTDAWRAPAKDCRKITYCGWDAGTASSTNCTIFNTYVEVKVFCNRLSCGVTHLRRSKIKHPRSCWTQLDYSKQDFSWYTDQLVKSLGVFPGSSPTPFQGYLTRPSTPFNITNLPPVSLMGIEEVLSVRLSQILNTYWYALLAATAVQPGDDSQAMIANKTATDIGHTPGVRQYAFPESIHVNFGWLIPLFFSIAVLIGLDLSGMYATSRSLGPEILFNVSSIIRDSPNVTLPRASSALSATDRARMNKDIVVRYGDVDGDDDVGTIAIATLRGQTSPVALREDRFYA